MGDWVSDMDPDERAEWERFVRHVREDAVKKIDGSAMVASILPNEPDVKFAVELGFAIMLDKPILVIVPPGREGKIPEHLRWVADQILEVDIDTVAGQEELAKVMRTMADGR